MKERFYESICNRKDGGSTDYVDGLDRLGIMLLEDISQLFQKKIYDDKRIMIEDEQFIHDRKAREENSRI